MKLPAAARAHDAARLHRASDERVRVVRIAWEDEIPVCFGDGPCQDLRHRDHVFVHICNANGTIEYEFAATVQEVSAEELSRQTFESLIDHIPLGRTLAEVELTMARLRGRRLLTLIA